jgi:hypothetical protein
MNGKNSVNGKAQPDDWQSKKSVKTLRSSAEPIAYQKEWFKGIKARITRGEPFALCSVNEIEEILTAMDIPFLVIQWWSSLISAKRLSPYYFDLLESKGYDLCRYCSLPFGCTMDHNPEREPWGGLPKPAIITSLTSCVHAKIGELWAREYGAHFFPFEVAAPTNSFPRWWEKIKDHWPTMIEPHRINLKLEELKALIRLLEITTGKTLNLNKLKQVMELVNEEAEYFKKARDLIAATIPCPVGLPDQFSSIMITHWHRGTEWARDQAKRFYEEVKEKADAGEAACPNEKIRLMWLGAGLWTNTSFYQYFEEKYGATFVCSLYLSYLADGYARDCFDDPLRALAARIVFLGHGNDWLISEAKRFKVDGMVQIVSGHCSQAVHSPMVKRAFENAGIPTLQIRADNVDAREWDDAKIKAQVSDFIEKRLLSR